MKLDLNNINPSISWVKTELIEQRIDGQFYKSEFVNNEIQIRKCNTVLLKEIYNNGDYGTLPDSNDYCDEGIYLIRGTDLRDLTIDEDNLIVVPNDYFNEKSEAKPGDILLLIKGATIDEEWSVSIVPKNSYKAIFNGSIFRIRLKEEYDPYYLTLFMSTKYFLMQKKRAISNTGIFYNDKDSIENFIIPIPTFEIQKYIGNKLRTIEMLREKARILQNEAFEILQHELDFNLGDKFSDKGKYVFIKDKPNIFYVSTDLIDNVRIEAAYYKNDYMEIESKLTRYKHGYKHLRDICTKITDGTHKTPNYIDKGTVFISSKNILKDEIDFENVKYISEEEHMEFSKRCNVESGDILFTKIGRIGYAKVVPNIEKPFSIFVSVALLKLKKEIDEYFLEVFLNSDYGNKQSLRLCKGSNQPDFHLEDIGKIKVPILPKEVQEKIGNKMREVEAIKKDIRILLKQAKQDIDDLIECNFDILKIKETN